MGRTLSPFSQLIESERRAWAPFRRALRKADQAVFDRLFDCAKLHVQAGVYLSRPWPFEVVAMAMLLEHHKRLEQLLAQLEALCRRACPPTHRCRGSRSRTDAAGPVGAGAPGPSRRSHKDDGRP